MLVDSGTDATVYFFRKRIHLLLNCNLNTLNFWDLRISQT